MGVGTNLLGYNNNEVEKKVIETIKKGNMSTLNSIEEILLSEKLINLHPWFDMARFTRSGGEANAVAITINSPGGSPVQSHLIYKFIRAQAKKNKIKVIVFAQEAYLHQHIFYNWFAFCFA